MVMAMGRVVVRGTVAVTVMVKGMVMVEAMVMTHNFSCKEWVMVTVMAEGMETGAFVVMAMEMVMLAVMTTGTGAPVAVMGTLTGMATMALMETPRVMGLVASGVAETVTLTLVRMVMVTGTLTVTLKGVAGRVKVMAMKVVERVTPMVLGMMAGVPGILMVMAVGMEMEMVAGLQLSVKGMVIGQVVRVTVLAKGMVMAVEMVMTHNSCYTLLVMGMVMAGETVMGMVWVKATAMVLVMRKGMWMGILGRLSMMAMVMVAAVTVAQLLLRLCC